MAHRKQGYRFKNDWTLEGLQATRRSEGFWKIAKTIPVDIEIMAEHRVLNLEKAKDYLDKAHSFAVLNCGCRTARGNCDAPLDVCLDMDNAAELVLSKDDFKDKNPRRITKEEALQVLERSHEAGLVHMAYDVMGEDKVNAICSCCSCCCAILSSVLRFGLFPQLLTSDTISVTDMSKCTGCGICVERCQFGAREKIGDSLAINPQLCMGCGLCVTKCPTTAIRLVAK
jgi:NAD-dependent dihydropyrimidine dehydrogenase PreA subunit